MKKNANKTVELSTSTSTTISPQDSRASAATTPSKTHPTLNPPDNSRPVAVAVAVEVEEQPGWFRRRLFPDALCPNYNVVVKYLTYLLLLSLAWGVLYVIFEERAGPMGSAFLVFVLFVCAYVGGMLMALIHLPPLLGMLMAGIILRNVNFFQVTEELDYVLEALRPTEMALTVILINAGLGLDPAALKKLSFVVLRLAFTPCLVEAFTACITSHFLLGFSWLWGLVLGCVLGAVSPAITVNSMINLKNRDFGVEKGVPTLVIAASSMDDLVAISLFNACLGIIFAQGSLVMQILHGPLLIIFGISFGIMWGILAIYIPHKDDPMVTYLRVVIIGGGGLFAVLGDHLVDYEGIGPLFCVVSAFVASCGWRTQGYTATYNPVEQVFAILWLVFQPILFGLIGTKIHFSELDPKTVGLGVCVLLIGLCIRCLTCFFVTCGSGLSFKERWFVAIAWLPKATVQAALGPMALDLARKLNASEDVINVARDILTIAILSILLTAPTGAVGIAFFGPRLLQRTPLPTPPPESNP